MHSLKRIPYITATHIFSDGPGTFLNRYLKEHKISHGAILHPFTFSPQKSSRYILWEKDSETIKEGRSFPPYALLYYLRDIIGILIFGWKHPSEIGIGFNNLNTIALLFLRALGRIKKVIYVTVDYTPIRFPGRFMNAIYHWIDTWCLTRADILLDSAEAMKEARIQKGIPEHKIRPTIIVEDGNDFLESKIKPIEELHHYELVYMGSMRDHQGISLFMEVGQMLSQENPNIQLLLMGGGEKLSFFKDYAKKLDIESITTFTGFIEDHQVLQERLRFGYLGFALYEDHPESFSRYSAVGKPKVYMGSGLPVVITNVPEIAKRIEESNGGIIVPYDKNVIAEKVRKILLDENMYKKMRESAISFAKKNTWENTFKEAFQKTQKILNYELQS